MLLFLKSFYCSLISLMLSIVFSAMMVVIYLFLGQEIFNINFFDLQKHHYLTFCFFLITPLWLLLLPFFSLYLSSHLEGFGNSIKIVVPKIFIYSLAFIISIAAQQFLLNKQNLNLHDIIQHSSEIQLLNQKKELSFLSKPAKQQLEISLRLHESMSKKNHTMLSIIGLYGLFLLIIAVFESMAKGSLHHYLRNTGLGITCVIILLFVLNYSQIR